MQLTPLGETGRQPPEHTSITPNLTAEYQRSHTYASRAYDFTYTLLCATTYAHAFVCPDITVWPPTGIRHVSPLNIAR